MNANIVIEKTSIFGAGFKNLAVPPPGAHSGVIAVALLCLVLAVGILTSARVSAQTVSLNYDAAGRLTGLTNSAGATAVYTYDSAGNVLAITVSQGQGLLEPTGPPSKVVTAAHAPLAGNSREAKGYVRRSAGRRLRIASRVAGIGTRGARLDNEPVARNGDAAILIRLATFSIPEREGRR